MFKRLIAIFLIFSFILSYCPPLQAQGFSINELPLPGKMVDVSAPFVPLALKGLVIDIHKPLEFQFIVDTGNGPRDAGFIKQESSSLIKYFMAGITIPEDDLWVNLSPYEKDRMVPDALGKTALGRDLLAQDYILKQLTASLIYPEKDLGREFWQRVYAEAKARFGTTDIPVNTFNKVWILPDHAQVFEHGSAAYITDSTLKVMLDEDYMAKQKHQATKAASLSSQVVRAIVLPEIAREVNTGRNFAPLRQIYQTLILAKWYKETVQNGLLDALYTDKQKMGGVLLANTQVKEQIYQRYLQAYKKGVFNYIKDSETPNAVSDAPWNQSGPRKYFSGGTRMKIGVDHSGTAKGVKVTGEDAFIKVDFESASAAMTEAASKEISPSLTALESAQAVQFIYRLISLGRVSEEDDRFYWSIEPGMMENLTAEQHRALQDELMYPWRMEPTEIPGRFLIGDFRSQDLGRRMGTFKESQEIDFLKRSITRQLLEAVRAYSPKLVSIDELQRGQHISIVYSNAKGLHVAGGDLDSLSHHGLNYRFVFFGGSSLNFDSETPPLVYADNPSWAMSTIKILFADIPAGKQGTITNVDRALDQIRQAHPGVNIEIIHSATNVGVKGAAALEEIMKNERPDIIFVRSETTAFSAKIRKKNPGFDYQAFVERASKEYGLKAIVRMGAGVDNIDKDLTALHGISGVRTHGNAKSVADLALYLMASLANMKGFPLAGPKEGITSRWENISRTAPAVYMPLNLASTKWPEGIDPDIKQSILASIEQHMTLTQDPLQALAQVLEGKTIGLFGFGAIAQETAAQLQRIKKETGANFKVIAYTQSFVTDAGRREEALKLGVTPILTTDEFFQTTNILSIHLPDGIALKVRPEDLAHDNIMAVINTSREEVIPDANSYVASGRPMLGDLDLTNKLVGFMKEHRDTVMVFPHVGSETPSAKAGIEENTVLVAVEIVKRMLGDTSAKPYALDIVNGIAIPRVSAAMNVQEEKELPEGYEAIATRGALEWGTPYDGRGYIVARRSGQPVFIASFPITDVYIADVIFNAYATDPDLQHDFQALAQHGPADISIHLNSIQKTIDLLSSDMGIFKGRIKVYNFLNRIDISNIGVLISKTATDILNYRNMGDDQLIYIRETLASHGLYFRGERPIIEEDFLHAGISNFGIRRVDQEKLLVRGLNTIGDVTGKSIDDLQRMGLTLKGPIFLIRQFLLNRQRHLKGDTLTDDSKAMSASAIKRLLLVDDNPNDRSLVDRRLSARGYTIIHAANGQEALRQLRSNQVSLIITDIGMPHGDGIDLVKSIRKGGHDLPIIILSGEVDRHEIESQNLGNTAVFQKTMGFVQLIDGPVLKQVQAFLGDSKAMKTKSQDEADFVQQVAEALTDGRLKNTDQRQESIAAVANLENHRIKPDRMEGYVADNMALLRESLSAAMTTDAAAAAEMKGKVRVARDKNDMARKAVESFIDAVQKARIAKRTEGTPPVMGIGTGSHIGLFYEALVEEFRRNPSLDLSDIVVVAQDEYAGFSADNPDSYRVFIMNGLINSLMAIDPARAIKPRNFISFQGDAASPQEEMKRMVSRIINLGGIDWQLVAGGRDGHFAFVVPAVKVGSLSAILSKSMQKNFRDRNEVIIDRNLNQDELMHWVKEMMRVRREQRLSLNSQQDVIDDAVRSRMTYLNLTAEPEGLRDQIKKELVALGERLLKEQKLIVYVTPSDSLKVEDLQKALPSELQSSVIFKNTRRFWKDPARVVDLTLGTILDNSRLFPSLNEVGLTAFTLVGLLLDARRIEQICFNEKMASVLYGMILGPLREDNPLSILPRQGNYGGIFTQSVVTAIMNIHHDAMAIDFTVPMISGTNIDSQGKSFTFPTDIDAVGERFTFIGRSNGNEKILAEAQGTRVSLKYALAFKNGTLPPDANTVNLTLIRGANGNWSLDPHYKMVLAEYLRTERGLNVTVRENENTLNEAFSPAMNVNRRKFFKIGGGLILANEIITNGLIPFLGGGGKIELLTSAFDPNKPSQIFIHGGQENDPNGTVKGILEMNRSKYNVFMYVYDEKDWNKDMRALISEMIRLKGDINAASKKALGHDYDKGFTWITYSFGANVFRGANLINQKNNIDADLFSGKLIQIAPAAGGAQAADYGKYSGPVIKAWERSIWDFKSAETGAALVPRGFIQQSLFSEENIRIFNRVFPRFYTIIPLNENGSIDDKVTMAASLDPEAHREYKAGTQDSSKDPESRIFKFKGKHETFTNNPEVLKKIEEIQTNEAMSADDLIQMMDHAGLPYRDMSDSQINGFARGFASHAANDLMNNLDAMTDILNTQEESKERYRRVVMRSIFYLPKEVAVHFLPLLFTKSGSKFRHGDQSLLVRRMAAETVVDIGNRHADLRPTINQGFKESPESGNYPFVAPARDRWKYQAMQESYRDDNVEEQPFVPNLEFPLAVPDGKKRNIIIQDRLGRKDIIEVGRNTRQVFASAYFQNKNRLLYSKAAATPIGRYFIRFDGEFAYVSQHDEDKDLTITVTRTQDAAMSNGGIDLNRIHVRRTGNIIKMIFDPAELRRLQQHGFDGFTAAITDFGFIKSPLPLMGVGSAN